METCGFSKPEKYEKILPLVDTFLFDYKETNREKHRELTGADNDMILSNLDYLYRNNAAIILRCPLVNGVNDTEEHLKGIADLSRKYPKLFGIELMPYHNMGLDKSLGLGMVSPLNGMKTTSEELKKYWMDAIRNYGCKKAVIG